MRRVGELTNVDITLLDNDQRAVNLVGDISDLLTACQRVRVKVAKNKNLHLESVRAELVVRDDVVEQ
jgi:hypothetical protein